MSSPSAVLAGTAGDNDTSRSFKAFLARRDTGAAFDILTSDKDLVDAFAWRVAYLTFEALQQTMRN